MKKEITIKDGKTFHFTLELKVNEKGKQVFSCSGKCRGRYGQILEDVRKYLGNSNQLFNIIYYLWKNYHLNDMHSGTDTQEAFLEGYNKHNHHTYEENIHALKIAGLYEDNGYKYGSNWLYREIPQNDLYLIKKIMQDF